MIGRDDIEGEQPMSSYTPCKKYAKGDQVRCLSNVWFGFIEHRRDQGKHLSRNRYEFWLLRR